MANYKAAKKKAEDLGIETEGLNTNELLEEIAKKEAELQGSDSNDQDNSDENEGDDSEDSNDPDADDEEEEDESIEKPDSKKGYTGSFTVVSPVKISAQKTYTVGQKFPAELVTEQLLESKAVKRAK